MPRRPRLEPPPPRSPIVDYADVSRLTGQTINHLRALYSRGVMPRRAHPNQPVWYREDIEHWIKTDPRATPRRAQDAERRLAARRHNERN